MNTKHFNAEAWAHAPPASTPDGPAHLLEDHLRAVAALAQANAHGPLAPWAYLAGLWHDLGKQRAGFQTYIRQANGAEAHIEGRVQDADKTHSAAGALWAEQLLAEKLGPQGRLLSRILQAVIAGHHAGLANWQGGNGALADRLVKDATLREFVEAMAQPTAIDITHPTLPDAMSALRALPLANERESGNPGRMALWIRMLFSALVDADFLDTEAYMNAQKASARTPRACLPDMVRELTTHLTALGSLATPSTVNVVRQKVLAQCLASAHLPPGVFSLTVPTGGGKTLSSLAFAVRHAQQHGLRRVVYAIPYTSIIEQTAEVFREVFRALGEEAVIEHHSNAEAEPEQENRLSRLACENWDAPLVVTTNVQLFESLFARKTARCRKLHNLARSVIVLDEAQLLPVAFLQPVIDVLRYLVQDFGCTVVLCTATQPALDTRPNLDAARGLRRGLGSVTELMADVPALYGALERVKVNLPLEPEQPRSWPELATELASHAAVLVIVNRRADAATLHVLLKQAAADQLQPGPWHLSALMCPQHRSDTIAQIKLALKQRRAALAAGLAAQPVRVVSTQLVEAGVDLDFPVVYRAMAGLDSVAQAAGRCNREGLLDGLGQVHVFVPPTPSPPGLLALARDTCKRIWHDRPEQPFALPLIQAYFSALYHDAPSTDTKGICEKLRLQVNPKALALPLQFRDAADAFKLIDNADGATVLVRYQSPTDGADINALIVKLERDGPDRWLMRKLQRYGVTIYQHQVKALLAQGDIQEVGLCPGLYVQRENWDGFYDPTLGARVNGAPGDPSAFVH